MNGILNNNEDRFSIFKKGVMKLSKEITNRTGISGIGFIAKPIQLPPYQTNQALNHTIHIESTYKTLSIPSNSISGNRSSRNPTNKHSADSEESEKYN